MHQGESACAGHVPATPARDYDAERQLRFAHDLTSHAYRVNARLA